MSPLKVVHSDFFREKEVVQKFLSVDPKFAKYPSFSPYLALGNNPLIFVDPDGGDIYPATSTAKQELSTFIKQPTSNSVVNKFFEANTKTDTKYTAQRPNGETFEIQTLSISETKGAAFHKMINNLQKEGAITEDDAKTATALFGALSEANPILEIGSYNTNRNAPKVNQLTGNAEIAEFHNKTGLIDVEYEQKIKSAKSPEEKAQLETESNQKQEAAINNFTESPFQENGNKGVIKVKGAYGIQKGVKGQAVYKTGGNNSHEQIKKAIQ